MNSTNKNVFDLIINFLVSLSAIEFALLIGGLGLAIGSFLNVVVYRLPIMMRNEWLLDSADFHDEIPPEEAQKTFNLMYPPSHCPSCNHRIQWFENVPVLSYLIQGGKCNHCDTSIPRSYPLLELICGILSAIVAYKFGVSLKTVTGLLLIWILLPLSVIDLKHRLLPDQLTLLLLWVGLIANCFNVFTDAQSAIFGATAGYLSLYIIFWGFKLITKKDGMGYGDFKLLSALGAVFGWEALPALILISSITATVLSLTLIVLKKMNREEAFPFGPYLSLAGLIWLMQLV